MKWTDVTALLSLAAVWGASYLFMRMGAGEFGPVALAGMRAAGAALLLLPLLAWRRGGLADLRRHWKGIAIVGLTNGAIPSVLFCFAALAIPAGTSALLTASTPLFTAAIGWIWLRDRLDTWRVAGLVVGLGGVLWLVWDSLGAARTHGVAAAFAALACLLAAILYGFSGNFIKRQLGAAQPMTVVAGSQLTATLVLALPMALQWPAHPPSVRAWCALAMLATACTAIAFVYFYRLIARIGAARAMTVTFLTPAFGVLWGTLFLGEVFSRGMAIGCAIILAGTALATGMVKPKPALASAA